MFQSRTVLSAVVAASCFDRVTRQFVDGDANCISMGFLPITAPIFGCVIFASTISACILVK